MKNVLFLGVTKYNLDKDVHLRKKFEGLAGGIKPYVLAKGEMTFGRKIFGADFYLLPKSFLFWPLAFFVALWLCLTKKIDVIIAQSPLVEGFLGTILKIIFRKELIVEIHGDWKEGPFLSKKRKFEFIQRKFIPFSAKTSLKNADKIRGVAEYLIDEAKKIAPDKPYFIFPTFTDLDSFLNEKETSFQNFVLFVGQLAQVKGVNILIEAFSKIEKDFPDFQLVLVGEGQEKEKLKVKSEKLKVIEKVEFRGRLSLEETKNIMKNCYCLVLPSLSEGLPRVLMEAMALGKPVIASNVGGIPELINDGQNGFLFEVGDSGQLAEKLKILLSNKNLAIAMGEKERSFIEENFSNEKYIENYLKMIYPIK